MNDRQITVLLADDEEMLLNALQRRLKARGYNVIVAENGRVALDLARANHVDIAVIDLKMPVMTGKELLKVLKEEFPEIKVIILSGHGFDSEDEEITKNIHASLAKPCEFEALHQVLKDVYEQD